MGHSGFFDQESNPSRGGTEFSSTSNGAYSAALHPSIHRHGDRPASGARIFVFYFVFGLCLIGPSTDGAAWSPLAVPTDSCWMAVVYIERGPFFWDLFYGLQWAASNRVKWALGRFSALSSFLMNFKFKGTAGMNERSKFFNSTFLNRINVEKAMSFIYKNYLKIK